MTQQTPHEKPNPKLERRLSEGEQQLVEETIKRHRDTLAKLAKR